MFYTKKISDNGRILYGFVRMVYGFSRLFGPSVSDEAFRAAMPYISMQVFAIRVRQASVLNVYGKAIDLKDVMGRLNEALWRACCTWDTQRLASKLLAYPVLSPISGMQSRGCMLYAWFG